MKTYEIEQKFHIHNPTEIRRQLKKLGAKKLASGHETNEIFDINGTFRKKKILLRLRRYGNHRVCLTLKGPRMKHRYTKRLEIEMPVDYRKTKAILNLLGYSVRATYSKKREEYKLLSCSVVVDYLSKLGWFIEIEGKPKAIGRIAKLLALPASARESRSYLKMLSEL